MDILKFESPEFIVLPAEAAENLSLEALGLLAWAARQGKGRLLGLPAAARMLGLSEEHLGKLLRELATFGYASLQTLRGPSGKLAGRQWVICPFGQASGHANDTSARADPPESTPEGHSTETRKIPVSVTSSKGTEEAAPGKVPNAADNPSDHPENPPFGGSLISSALNAQDPAETFHGYFKHLGPKNGSGQIAGADQAAPLPAAGQQKRRKNRAISTEKDIHNKNQLPVTDVSGEEVGLCMGNKTSLGITDVSGEDVAETSCKCKPVLDTDTSASQKKAKNAKYRTKAVNTWNAGDFVAYVLDEAQARGKTLLVPKAAIGQHIRWLLERARAHFGEHGPQALKDLIDTSLPHMNGTGWLLREAEWFWSHWQPPMQGEWQW